MASGSDPQNPGTPAAPSKDVEASKYKDTLNLPRTDFPMKASLPQREPVQLKKWEEQGLYAKIIARNAGKPLFVLHDGPPYANGHIHQGHILNKTLKDIVVKYANMSGKLAEFIPGWDCHGLPIELKTEEELGSKKREMSKVEVRRACRKYAEKFIDIQREEFKRIGVFARFDEPYLTMSHAYEAQTARELAKFARRGALVRGKKPVYWCIKDRTALADAEVELEDHTSPSIYVAFPSQSTLPGEKLADRRAEFVIWTTTPWTLPANLAISVHPEVTYVAYDLNGRTLVVAKDLLAAFLSENAPDELSMKDVKLGAVESGPAVTSVASLKDPNRILGYFDGKSLEGMKYTHVLNGKSLPITLGEHVTTESGTGLVHTAPGHGEEDYEVGRRYQLGVLAPVDAAGKFTEEAGEFVGQLIWDANPKIIAKLVELKALLSDPKATIKHKYAHCWRCKKPVIFRATPQWFISMNATELRQKALAEIDRVQWIPKWGRERIFGMIENRPDWCVSRQRAWGVPIPVFYCAKDDCETEIVDPEVMEKAADLFEKESADAWFTHPAEDFLKPGTKCARCGGTTFRKEEDILDVWFDSGTSYAAVAEKRTNMQVPVDLYLEGSDQHRGWFHSSLLCSVGTRDRAPYKAVLTHGFVVGGDGRKLSKSEGASAEGVLKSQGAEILRLWVAAADYRDDIRFSPKIIEGLSEGYRKIRNTLRYALSNLADFDPSKDAVPESQLTPIDRWALARLNILVAKVRKAYEEYEFHVVYHSVVDFCATDLSAVYFDVLKDRLYTAGTRSRLRRSGQTVVHQVLFDLLRLLAPIMSFTCDEAYSHLAHRTEESIFLCGLPEARPAAIDETLLKDFETVLAVRSDVQKVLEAARRDKLIGSPLEAKVTLAAQGGHLEFLKRHGADLPAIFIVSRVDLVSGPLAGAVKGETQEIEIKVERAPGEKCPRCWNYSLEIDASRPVCSKCAEALAG